MLNIINSIVGETTKDFERWIRKNRPKDYESWQMRYIIWGNELEKYKLFLIKEFPIYFFPRTTIQYGMVVHHTNLYNLIFMGKNKFDWEKANKKINKWLKIQYNKQKTENENVSIHINEYNCYFVLYKHDSALCSALSNMLELTLLNIKSKVSSDMFDLILKNKVFEMFMKPDIYFTDMFNELMVLDFYLNEGYELIDINHKLQSGKDLDFEMLDKNKNKVFIEVVNKHITHKDSLNLREYISGKLYDKYREKITTKSDYEKNVIICQTLTPNYSGFNLDLIKLQSIYKIPFDNLNFKYNTFCFFVSNQNTPCFVSMKDMKTYVNGKLVFSTNLV